MNLASSCRMKEIDRISIEERGFGDLILMENAGIRILEAALSAVDFGDEARVVCFAGSGNNGGDALVIARQLFSMSGNPVTVVISKEEGSAAFEFHLKLCRNLGIRVIIAAGDGRSENKIAEAAAAADIIFDGIAGTGINGALRGRAASLTELINKSSAVKISIDVPSGIGEAYPEDAPAVRADYTLTVGLPKRCLYLPRARACCGIIRRVRIGFPPDVLNAAGLEPDGCEWHLITDDDISRLMPVSSPDDYKNSRGHLAVFAGSPGTTGAASLCAEAALRTRAGLVSLFAGPESFPILAAKHSAVMVKPEPESETGNGRRLPELSIYDAAAAGPGWGTGAERREQLDIIINESRGVLDADAINILAAKAADEGLHPNLSGRWIITPHAGEFKRMFPALDAASPYEAVPAAAEQINAVVLLKGVTTFIAAPDGRTAVLDGCFPRLGTAGSGDVLCGIIGGYAASGMDLFNAAVLGAAIHLRAGVCCGEMREWFTADELLEYIGRSN